MASKELQFNTTLTVKQCAEMFRVGAQKARGLGSVLGGAAAKVLGNDQSGYFTPNNDSPFASLDDNPPDFSVGVFVPKFGGGGQGNGTAIHMYVSPLASEELAELLRGQDAYVAASLDDPCSNALLEALACGLPAAYRESGGHPELVGDGGLPFRVDEELGDVLERLVDELEIRRAAISTTSISSVADRYLAVLGLRAAA